MDRHITFWWRKSNLLSATFLLSLFIGIVSCKKDKHLLGGNVVDKSHLLNSGGIDTFMLDTYTIAVDSVITSNPRYALLGAYNDPEFGLVDAGFYTQIRLSGLNPDFSGDPIVVDSFVLALEFAGSYGSTSTQTFEVYRLNEQLYYDSTYYQFSSCSIQSENIVLGSGTVRVDPSVNAIVGDDTLKPQLRIHLKPSKGMDIISDVLSGAYASEFGNDELFATNYYKGLYVKTNGNTPSSGQGNVGYFNLLDQDSKLTIYYTQGGIKKFFDFNINDKCARFNHVDIDNSGKFVQEVIDDPTKGLNEFYAQSLKSRAVVDFPTLKNIPKNSIIHSAILYLPVQHLSSSKLTPSSSITVITSETKEIVETFDYNSLSGEYAIDIRPLLQAYLIGQYDSPKILISPSSFISSVDRVIFNGPATTNKKKPKLVLTYTEF